MKIFAYNLSGTIFEGEADILIVPSSAGELSILENHIPIVTPLKSGTIVLKQKGEIIKEIPVASGTLEVSDNKAILLLN